MADHGTQSGIYEKVVIGDLRPKMMCAQFKPWIVGPRTWNITLPDGHTWKSFTNLLLQTLPEKTRKHYIHRFKKFLWGWKQRGYPGEIPDEAPHELESKCWVPSWRRMARTLLRNDYWCKGLGQTQPKSEAYGIFKEMQKSKKKLTQSNLAQKQKKLF